MLIVKPTYFRDDNGVTVRSLHFVYDTDNLRHENHPVHGIYMVPSYALTGGGDIVELLGNHFEGKGVHRSKWRLTPPNFRNIDQLGMYLGSVEVID